MKRLCIACLMLLLMACSSGGVSEEDGDTHTPDGDRCTGDHDCPVGLVCDVTLGECRDPVLPDGGGDGDRVDGDRPDGDPDGDVVDGDQPADGDTEPPYVDTDGRMVLVVPEFVDFGFAAWGSRVTRAITIFNRDAAMAPVDIQEVTFKSEEHLDFSLEAAPGYSVPAALMPGEELELLVTYHPSDAVEDLGEQVLVTTNDVDYPLIRVDLAPRYKGTNTIAADPADHEFGEVPVGGSEAIDIAISNAGDPEGNRVLRISSILLSTGSAASNDFVIEAERMVDADNPLFLNPGDTFTVTATFMPTSVDDLQDTVFITHNDPDNQPVGRIPLSGRGINSVILVTPSPIDFGSRKVGAEHDLPVTVRNIGEELLTISVMELTMSGTPFSLYLPGQNPWILAEGEAVEATVTYLPVVVGEHRNALRIVNDSDVPLFRVEVMGEGAEPRIDVDPAELDFGAAQLGQRKEMWLRILSTGDIPLTLSELRMSPVGSDAFGFIDSPDLYNPIAPGEFNFRDVLFFFEPGSPGPNLRNSCRILSDASNADTDGGVEVILSGSAFNPVFHVDPREIRFDPVAVGSTAGPETITVSNIGSGTLTLFDIRPGIGSSLDFFITSGLPDFPLLLERNESVAVEVEYTPSGPGEDEGSVMITHDDYDLFEEGDLDRTGFHVVLHAEGPANRKPMAVLTANGSVSPLQVIPGTTITLDGSQSYDPDGDNITAFNFGVETCPVSSCPDPGDDDSVETVVLDAAGLWIFSLRVQDDHGAWSDTAFVEVSVIVDPVAVLRANGELDEATMVVDNEITLDGSGSFDPDGGAITEWHFTIEAAPPGHDELSGGPGAERFVTPGQTGDWEFGLEVVDDEGTRSAKTFITVHVRPPEELLVLLHGINNCILFTFGLSLLEPGGELCDGAATCPFAIHSGACSGLPGGNDNGVSIQAGAVLADGLYKITVSRLAVNWEHYTLSLYRDDSETPFWEMENCFPLLGTNLWDVYLYRDHGRWQAPHLWGPENSDCSPVR